MRTGLLLGSVAAAAALAALLVVIVRRRRNRSSIREALKAIAVDQVEDVLVPDGMGGEIHIEHLLLTARGIVILNVKRYEGVIFAGDRMDQWTVIGPRGRSTFPNPLGTLYDRIAAVRQLVRDVDVAGFVVFPAEADFSKGRPDEVLLPDDLAAAYARPDKRELGKLTEAYASHWETIKASARPAAGV